MESRPQNSETSTRKNYENNDMIILTVDGNNLQSVSSNIQQYDQFWITFNDQDILTYSNLVDNSLTIQNSLSYFSSQFWRCLFKFKFVDSSNSNKVHIIHCQTNLYLCADYQKNTQQSSIVSIALTNKVSQYCQFYIQSINMDSIKGRQQKMNVLYDNRIRIKNAYTQKYLQITKQNAQPHLSSVMQTQIVLKLFNKNQIFVQDLWITNQQSNYLQNGDLIMLQNSDKNSCLVIQFKNQLIYKNSQLKYIVNKKLLQTQNCILTQRQISQINNSNIIYGLWRVIKVGSFCSSNNSIIYNRDTIIFKHCFTNVCLLKSWSGNNSFSSNLFQLGREGEQSTNIQNCGFHVKNTIAYCFDSKKSNQNVLSHQPLYLHDLIQLDHRVICSLKKVSSQTINYLRLFNLSIIQFCQVLLDFILNNPKNNDRKNKLEYLEDKNLNKSISRKMSPPLNHQDARQSNELQYLQILTVDYDRLKQLIRAYHQIHKLLIMDSNRENVCSNFYVIKTILLALDVIGNLTKDMADIKTRKKPILQPLILSTYEYLINVLSQQHFHLKTLILNCLSKMIKIDGSSTILIIYFLSRIWQPNNVIDTLLKLVNQIQVEDQQLLFTCIGDIIQHCSNMKQEQPKKIQQMFSMLNVEVTVHDDHGVTIKTDKFQSYSIFDFREANKKMVQLLRIAVFSEAFLDRTPKDYMKNDDILMSLIYQLDCIKRKKIDTVNQAYPQSKSSKIKTLAHLDEQQDKPFYVATLVEFINFYLLNTCVSTISTLKNRKFVLLNPNSQIQCFQSSSSLNQNTEQINQFEQSNNNYPAEQSSLNMIKKQMYNPNIVSNCNLNIKQTYYKRKGKQNINIYPLVNYDEEPFPIVQIIKHLDKLIQNTESWDTTKIEANPINSKVFPCSIREKPSMEEQVPREDQREMSKVRKSISAAIVTLVNYTSVKFSSFDDGNVFPNKVSLDHLGFMLQGFNTLISIMDIILSVGYVTIKMLCNIQEFALQITAFLIKFKNDQNKNQFTNSNFINRYERTANQLGKFYKQQQLNGGLSVEQIMVEQKIRQLTLSLNQIYSTILLLKKRLIAHPAIQVAERHHLFNFQKCINWYLQIYTSICVDSSSCKQIIQIETNPNHKLHNRLQNKFDMEIIKQLLNFYYGKYHNQKQQITLICLPITNISNRKQKNIQLYSHTSKVKIKNCINQQNQQSQNSNQIQQNSRQDQSAAAIIAQQITTNKNIQRKFISSFVCCQQIIYNIQLLSQTRQNIEKIQSQKNPQVTKLISQMKKLLDIINSKLNDFKNGFNKNIDECIIRAYEVSEKLTQAIFCTVYFQDDFIIDIVRFLCDHPPLFHNLARLHDKINYSLPVMKIFVKSLEQHLQKIIKLAKVQNQIASQLKQVVQTITKVIQECKNQLKESQFILVMGVICEVFPNRTLSQRIYHILLGMHSEQRNKLKISTLNNKMNYNKLMLDGNLKGKISLAKGITVNSALSDYKTFRLNPGKIMEAFKTLQTFKDLVKQAQSEQQKSAQLMGYGQTQNANLTQNIYNINRHISLIFRLCQNSEQVNRHFTQNIIKYDSLLLIAFDIQIPIKYKIPLSIYFRNDERIIDDDIATNDYLVWIAQTLRQYEQYLTQLPQYIFNNDIQQQQYHNHIASKAYRQKANHKVSLLVYEHPQYRDEIGTSSAFVTSVNTKISPLQYFYWQLLYFRPFMHKEQGLLVFLEEIVINMKQFDARSQRNFQQDINKSIVQIFDHLKSLRQKIQKRINRSQTNYQKQQSFQNSISKGLLRKIRKLMLLIKQKFPKLKNSMAHEVQRSESAVYEAATLLLKHNLMKKFIKIFYYNEYKNINLPLFYDKKQKDESQASDNSRLSFKHSRSSKMSHNSAKDNFKIAQMALFKKTHKKVSIKQFQLEEDDGCKSNAGMMLNRDRFDMRKLTNQSRTSTIKLNFNAPQLLKQTNYMFYEISKLLSKVCELVYNPIVRSRLQECFIHFYQYSGAGEVSAAILKNQTLGKLKCRRNQYIKLSNINRYSLGQCGYQKSISQNNDKFNIKLKDNGSRNLRTTIIIIKNLIAADQINVAAQLLKSIASEKQKKSSINNLSKIYSCANFKQNGSLDYLVELTKIFKLISSKPVVNYVFQAKYLLLLKFLLLVFLPSKQPTLDSSHIKLEKKISNYLVEYLNKILFVINKQYEKKLKKNAQSRFEREKRGKKQTLVSMVSRIRQSTQFNEFKIPQIKMDDSRKQNIEGCEDLIDYLPEMQTDLYRIIEIYGIVQARMSLLQKQLYQLISNKLLKMIYGMTLGSSLKLILKALLQKCHFNSVILLPDIISNNQKLQHFVEIKIQQMSNLNNLISSNMSISESLSFISIFYDYMYRLLWDYYLSFSDSFVKQGNGINKQKQQQYSPPKIRVQMWESICVLEQKITLLIKQQKRKEKGMKKSSSFSHFLQANKTKQDHQRFCLLHKILSQSINLFNLKFMIQAKSRQILRLRRKDNKLYTKKQELIIWTLTKFIHSRRSVCISKIQQNNEKANSNLNLGYNQIQIYTQLYDSLEHVVLSLNEGKNQLLFSFLSQNLSSPSLFKGQNCDRQLTNNIFFYKRYGDEWKEAVIGLIKGQQNQQRQQSQQRNKQSGQEDEMRNSKQIKIFHISDYLIGQAPNKSNLLIYHINQEMILKFLLGISLVTITLCHAIIFMRFPFNTSQDQIQPLIYVNLFYFISIVINKMILFWRVAKLKSHVNHRLSMNSSQSKPNHYMIIRNIFVMFHPTLITMFFMLAMNLCAIYSYVYIPLLYFVMALVSYKVPDRFFRTFWNIAKATWILLLLMGTVVWFFYFYKFSNYIWNSGGTIIGQDTMILKFIKSISGAGQQTSPSWFVQIIQNVFLVGLFVMLIASIISQMRWISQKKLSYGLSSQKKCLICNSENQQHIKYNHNVIKWIDLQVILRSKSNSSLSCLQLFLKNKIQKQDSTLFSETQNHIQN